MTSWRFFACLPMSMCLCITAVTLPLLMLPGRARCAVEVIVGPTPIIDGEAKAAADITVMNEKLAFALAVGSPAPYGVPRGAIVDVAPVVNGVVGRDCVVFADFIPNNWSAWPNTYQRIDILERGPQRAVVRAVRDWGKAQVVTLYTLESNADAVTIQTTLTNGGSAALTDLLSGLTLWPKRGYFFGVPGLRRGVERIEDALADRVVAYDEDWSVTLHAPYADHVANGSMDMYRRHSLQPGESRVFDAWLQVGSSGDLRPVLAAEIARKHLDAGVVRGRVRTHDGQSVDSPVVVIEKQGKPYAWVVGAGGAYELTLPAGDYAAYATAKNFSQSAKAALHVTAGSRSTQDFRDLQSPGRIEWSIAQTSGHRPIDARISITEGQQPLVQFLGRRNFFTELQRKGRVEVAIAPGDYVFTISAGGGFLSRRQEIKVRVAPGATTQARASITPLFDPPSRRWYSADLHHHADQAEAVTPPSYLARSQLAAGLDVLFVSDHDSTVNHRALQGIADERGLPFFPAAELSASWGHFNAYPLTLGGKLGIDTGTASIGEIIAAGRRQGAVIIQVNHPFIPYGYFTSVRDGVARGGFDPAFDLIEINAAAAADDRKVLQTLWDFWNAGQHYYLSGGTDTHDVWRDESGSVRTFAHIDGPVTAKSFAESLKAGHAYVTSGPLIFPSVIFGDDLTVTPDAGFTLSFDLQSVAGVRSAQLISGGVVLKASTFPAASSHVHVDFALRTPKSTWYALLVEDDEGHKAYSDPIWVDAVGPPAAAGHAP